MSIATNIAVDMSATGYSPWVRLNECVGSATLQLSSTAVASPVGAITVEFSNDVNTITNEQAGNVASADSAAIKSDVTGTLTVTGAALSNGYDGSGAKVSYMALPAALPGFARVKYTRTSGGSGDTLSVRFCGR